MRVSVDPSRCQGHTLCVLTAPGVFASSDDDGHAVVMTPQVPADQVDAVRVAVDSCPENAISIHE